MDEEAKVEEQVQESNETETEAATVDTAEEIVVPESATIDEPLVVNAPPPVPQKVAGRQRRLAHSIEDFQKGFKRMTGRDIKIPITDEQMRRGKVQRNDKCPCGSGKKFKACCIMVRQMPWRG